MAYPGAIIVKRVRDAVVLNLRRTFRTDTDYPYVDVVGGGLDFNTTKIAINDVTPGDHLFYPSIIVSALSGEETRFLQEDFISSKPDGNGGFLEVRGAPMTFTVSIAAQCLDTIARDELMDKIYQKFKIITDDLADRGIGIIKTSLESDKREFIQDRWIYTSGLRMTLYGEWTEEDVDTSDTLQKIKSTVQTETGQISQELRIL